MNADDLKASLQPFYEDCQSVGVCVSVVLKGQEQDEPVRLDIEAEALSALKELFMDRIRKEILEREDLSVLNLSSADERRHAVYIYDLEVPSELLALEKVVASDNLPLLNLSSNSLAAIKALLVEIGNNERQMVLYKTLAPINIFGRAGLFLKKSPTRLEKLDDEFLRVNSSFQMLRIDGKLLIVDIEAVEKSFGFHDIIKREAAAGVSVIEARALLENPEALTELLEDVRYARKLTKVAKESPVLKAGIPNSEIVSFCQTFPKLVGKIRFNEAQDRILLDTRVSKDLFIRLLMDDFLTSELTKFHYTSLAKDTVVEEEAVTV